MTVSWRWDSSQQMKQEWTYMPILEAGQIQVEWRGYGSEPEQYAREQSLWPVEACFRRMHFGNRAIWLLYLFCLWLGELGLSPDSTTTSMHGNKESTCNPGDTGNSGSIPGSEDSLEEGMAIHSSILVGKIPWTEELADSSPWGYKESNTTELTEHAWIPGYRKHEFL